MALACGFLLYCEHREIEIWYINLELHFTLLSWKLGGNLAAMTTNTIFFIRSLDLFKTKFCQHKNKNSFNV